MNEAFADSLRTVAFDSGADIFGIAEAAAFSGYVGKRSPFAYVEAARSVIVIGHHVTEPTLDVYIDSVGGKRSYYFINEVIGGIASEVIRALMAAGKNATLSPYNGLFAKDAAVLAGLGSIGRNNLLLTERFGPRLRLRTVVTDADLPKGHRTEVDFCGGCSHPCWAACPAGAFVAGQFDRAVCSEYTDRHAKKLSDHARAGCRDCELACPIGG